MCDKSHTQDGTRRIPRRRSTLVFAPGERALAASDWFPVVAHRAVYSRALLGLPARSGSRQLCALRPQQEAPVLSLRARGTGGAGPAGGRQWPKARRGHARSGATLYGSTKGQTSRPCFGEKEETYMIAVRYQQCSIYERLAVNVMADYKELMWEGGLLKVDKFLEDQDLV